MAEGYYCANDDESCFGVDRVCLQEGIFEFTIRDSYGDGINDPGYYNLTSEGEVIVNGGGYNGFMWNETTLFAIPFLVKPSTQPTLSTVPTETTIPSQLPSFLPTQFVCESATSMKQCIEQPCHWDIENGTCVDARGPSPSGGGGNCLDPNPDSFEDGTFPSSPWSISGEDGVWSVATDKSFDGTTSLKSPTLEGRGVISSTSNATLIICDDFLGGVMRLQAYASVGPPMDIFIIYVDGETVSQLVGVNEWEELAIQLQPGPHVVNFSYQYNPFELEDMLLVHQRERVSN